MPQFHRLIALFVACLMASFAAHSQNAQVTIAVDANANRHAISPYIYGVADADTATLQDLNFTVHRYGGNNSSRYNWQLNADNRGMDWYFESIGESSATAADRTDGIIAASKAAGAEAMITVPIIGWVAKLGANRGKLASFSQAKYGAQTDADWNWMPDAGNGVLQSNNQNITGNDPNDANVPNSTSLQSGFARHTVTRFGTAASGGLKYYLLDNEHSIWFSTHRDVAPTGATMDQIRQKMIDYASVIKAADASAKIVGPEEWGWGGYLYSGYDQQYGAAHGWCCYPDRAAHNNMDYMPWLLDQLHQYEVQHGQRLLDVFSLHYYPQENEFSNDTSTATQLVRNRSTRSLWDPNYTDTSWINDKVYLIPRMKQWVASYYPGLQTAITEYNWGAENHINGATAQADILGIFGREGLDFSARWTTPGASTPTYKAMKIYRNYDGNHSTFGDTSVRANVPNPDQLSAFAALRTSDGALTLMVVNKVLSGNTPVQVNLANFNPAGTAKVWQLTSGNSINHLTDITLSGTTLNATVPPQSVTMFVLSPNIKVQRAYVSAKQGNDANAATSCPVTSPCRTFAGAAAVVNSGGEVVAMDSGEYGAIAVSSSLALVGVPGAAVEIAAASGNAITVATPGVNLILRGLTLNGTGASNGVYMTAGAGLSAENCVISGFSSGAGVAVSGAINTRIVNTLLRDNGTGISLSDGAIASVFGSKVLGSATAGIAVRGTAASTTTSIAVSGTVVFGKGTGTGISVQSTSASAAVRADIIRSAIGMNAVGVGTSSSGGGMASVTMSRSRVSVNGTGLAQSGVGALMRTLDNNMLVDNASDTSGTLSHVVAM